MGAFAKSRHWAPSHHRSSDPRNTLWTGVACLGVLRIRSLIVGSGRLKLGADIHEEER